MNFNWDCTAGIRNARTRSLPFLLLSALSSPSSSSSSSSSSSFFVSYTSTYLHTYASTSSNRHSPFGLTIFVSLFLSSSLHFPSFNRGGHVYFHCLCKKSPSIIETYLHPSLPFLSFPSFDRKCREVQSTNPPVHKYIPEGGGFFVQQQWTTIVIVEGNMTCPELISYGHKFYFSAVQSTMKTGKKN